MSELLSPSGAPAAPSPSSAPITITSLPPPTLNGHAPVSLPPSAPSEYLRQMTAMTLSGEGFEGAEAGALCEVERLLEEHILRLFASAKEYAELANRLTPNAADLLSSQDEAQDVGKLRRESKRRRIALELPLTAAPPSPPQPRTLDLLVDFTRNPKSGINTDMQGNSTLPSASTSTGAGEDRKPTLAEMEQSSRTTSALPGAGESGEKKERMGQVPVYAHEGAPGLPGAWTRPRWDRVPKQDDTPPPESLLITASSLEFVRKSASSGDIPPELGIVNYRLVQGKDRKRGLGADSLAPVPITASAGSKARYPGR